MATVSGTIDRWGRRWDMWGANPRMVTADGARKSVDICIREMEKLQRQHDFPPKAASYMKKAIKKMKRVRNSYKPKNGTEIALLLFRSAAFFQRGKSISEDTMNEQQVLKAAKQHGVKKMSPGRARVMARAMDHAVNQLMKVQHSLKRASVTAEGYHKQQIQRRLAEIGTAIEGLTVNQMELHNDYPEIR